MPNENNSIALFLTGQLPLILIVAAILAWLVSILLLKRYHAAVLKSMNSNSGITPETSETLTPPKHVPASPATTLPDAATLYNNLHKFPWYAVAVYALAGVGYACSMAIIYLISGNFEVNIARFLIMFLVYLWPLVLAVNLIAITFKRTALLIASAYFILYTLLGIVLVLRNPSMNLLQAFIPWLVYNLPATILFFLFLNRRIRAVGPLVFTFLSLSITGSLVILSVVGSSDTSLMSAVDAGMALGLGATGVLISMIIIGLILFGIIGWGALLYIRTKYENKKLSDQSVTLDALWLIFTLVHVVFLAHNGSQWMLIGLLSFIVYNAIVSAGFSWWNRHAAKQNNVSLLFLRVFSLGKRSEQLYDKLTNCWRYVGSIQLIAGPDLAKTTVEPHEFLDFISGKLSRRFIDNSHTLATRLSEMDIEPDKDKRFRISDFFCYDNTWKMVLSRLVGQSKVVLIDLRGFSANNDGCKFELQELLNYKPLKQVVIAVDKTTNEKYLHHILQQLWQEMKLSSPNKMTTPDELKLVRLSSTSQTEVQKLLRNLCEAATALPLKMA